MRSTRRPAHHRVGADHQRHLARGVRRHLAGRRRGPTGEQRHRQDRRLAFDDHPDNEPHVGCLFQVDWYGFDAGDLNSHVTFELQPPTAKSVVVLEDDVFIGEDDNSGGGSEAGLDASATYDLTDTLTTYDQLPQQGWHVKVTLNNDGSQGADTKFKVFWVTGCDTPPPTTSTTENPYPTTTTTTPTTTSSTTTTAPTTTSSTTTTTPTTTSSTTTTAPTTTSSTTTTTPTTTSTTTTTAHDHDLDDHDGASPAAATDHHDDDHDGAHHDFDDDHHLDDRSAASPAAHHDDDLAQPRRRPQLRTTTTLPVGQPFSFSGASTVCAAEVPTIVITFANAFPQLAGMTGTLTMADLNGNVVSTQPLVYQPNTTVSLLYPGTRVNPDGSIADVPGWVLNSAGFWVRDPSDEFLRNGIVLTYVVNPTATATVTYPPESSACANPNGPFPPGDTATTRVLLPTAPTAPTPTFTVPRVHRLGRPHLA